MYTLSVAVDVNPPGATPRLTQDQVWRGLVIKAENAVLFVPRMQSCTVLSYVGAVKATLARVRRLAGEGRL
jgi:hypothetical protein